MRINGIFHSFFSIIHTGFSRLFGVRKVRILRSKQHHAIKSTHVYQQYQPAASRISGTPVSNKVTYMPAGELPLISKPILTIAAPKPPTVTVYLPSNAVNPPRILHLAPPAGEIQRDIHLITRENPLRLPDAPALKQKLDEVNCFFEETQVFETIETFTYAVDLWLGELRHETSDLDDMEIIAQNLRNIDILDETKKKMTSLENEFQRSQKNGNSATNLNNNDVTLDHQLAEARGTAQDLLNHLLNYHEIIDDCISKLDLSSREPAKFQAAQVVNLASVIHLQHSPSEANPQMIMQNTQPSPMHAATSASPALQLKAAGANVTTALNNLLVLASSANLKIATDKLVAASRNI